MSDGRRVEELDEITALRRSLKATRAAIDANTEVSEALCKQLARFNGNIEDLMVLVEQLLPLAEGAAAGNQVLGMVLPVVKGLLARRRSRQAESKP